MDLVDGMCQPLPIATAYLKPSLITLGGGHCTLQPVRTDLGAWVQRPAEARAENGCTATVLPSWERSVFAMQISNPPHRWGPA